MLLFGIQSLLEYLLGFYGEHILVLGHVQTWHNFCRSCKCVSALLSVVGWLKLRSFRSTPYFLNLVVKGIIP